MKWKAATYLFIIGYLIASIVGYTLYMVSPIAMWIGMFTLMPLVFTYLAFVYYKRHVQTPARKGIFKLSAYWILLSFVLDGIIYIVVLPIAFGAEPNWTFFIDQSPWIWLAYISLIIITAAGFFVFNLTKSVDNKI